MNITVTERLFIMPLPCPLFDIWHRHAFWVTLAAMGIAGGIAWVSSSEPSTTVCPKAMGIPQATPPLTTPTPLPVCHPRDWIGQATHMGLQSLHYSQTGADRQLIAQAPFTQCMAFLRWTDMTRAPLTHLVFQSKSTHGRIACAFTFHCPA